MPDLRLSASQKGHTPLRNKRQRIIGTSRGKKLQAKMAARAKMLKALTQIMRHNKVEGLYISYIAYGPRFWPFGSKRLTSSALDGLVSRRQAATGSTQAHRRGHVAPMAAMKGCGKQHLSLAERP